MNKLLTKARNCFIFRFFYPAITKSSVGFIRLSYHIEKMLDIRNSKQFNQNQLNERFFSTWLQCQCHDKHKIQVKNFPLESTFLHRTNSFKNKAEKININQFLWKILCEMQYFIIYCDVCKQLSKDFMRQMTIV